MTKRFIEMGQIVAPSGIRGEVKINPNCHVSDFATYAPFFDEHGHTLKVSVKRIFKNQVIALINDVRDRNSAEALRGTKLFVQRKSLPTLKDNEYYVCDLINMTVKENSKVIGSVIDVQNYGASDILQIKKSDGSELLLAMSPATILNVDLTNKEILVDIPQEVEANDEI